ncbi:MAG: hypothetical protein K0S18_145 [Anaerocolumna sp.]|jgi:hypothetical protein|nr:hypothetical protein [Anaerocolumna sp.]
MGKQDLFDIGKHFIVSDLWIYKYYKEAVKLVLMTYKKILNVTSTESYKLSYELWLEAKSGMYEPPKFQDWCIDMETE